MREIKFRVWDKANKILVNSKNKQSEIKLDYDTNFLPVWCQYEIMQYTGLKDKNGVEIYEGDIIQYKTYSKNTLGFAVVGYSNSGCGYILQNKELQVIGNLGKWNIPNLLYCGEYEIIGNIYENPELLQSN